MCWRCVANERLMAERPRAGPMPVARRPSWRKALPGIELDEALCRTGCQGAAGLRWARIRLRRLQRPPREHWLLVLAQSKGSDRLRVLRGLRPDRDAAERSRACRGSALDHRGMLPGRQRRSRARSLRGAQLARLASPRHARHAGPRLPHGDARRGRLASSRQTEQKESHTHRRPLVRSPSRRSAP